MVAEVPLPDYGWDEHVPPTEAYLLRALQELLNALTPGQPTAAGSGLQVLDLGCGNGALAAQMVRWGYQPVGVNPSSSGIPQARAHLPGVAFSRPSAEPEQLASLRLPPFDVVVSTEVVEHVYTPRRWAAAAFAALKPGGLLICSTPYHGYLKNCALALTGKLDAHFTTLWDGGHIKFWSRRTSTDLLEEAGFAVLAFRGAGCCSWLWNSMLLSAHKPLA